MEPNIVVATSMVSLNMSEWSTFNSRHQLVGKAIF